MGLTQNRYKSIRTNCVKEITEDIVLNTDEIPTHFGTVELRPIVNGWVLNVSLSD